MRSSIITALLFATLPSAVTVAHAETHANERHDEAVEIARQAKDPTHWAYVGEHGPTNWPTLNDDFEVCGGGPYQSPVALVSESASVHNDELLLVYGASPLDEINNGHTIQMNREAGDDHLLLNGHRYELIQGHFHSPSEHTLNGESFPMELHLVHVDAFDHLAVVGIPIRAGTENALFKDVFEHMPTKAGEHYMPNEGALDLQAILPKELDFLHYLGSLTTPPCTENVQWLVIETPLEMSKSQIDEFVDVVGENARPVQSLHHRVVTRNHAGGPSK
ncbi:MAG: carbonic anhydrase [Candidatus Azotimanducaceae bacterium]|jgi:carbonic anhydrase